MLNIKPQTSKERKLLFIETLLNLTNKISKVSPNSILDGIAGGVSKLLGKAEKDIILAVSQLYPDTAHGTQLDQVALNYGIAARFGASKSSTYIRISATPGTIYLQNTHTFKSTSGYEFELEQDETIGAFGYNYVKVRSIVQGVKTNVDPLTISKVNPVPVGHISVINESIAEGGRDIETDEELRVRIKQGANILSRGTIGMLEQKFISINPSVLRCRYHGLTLDGKVRIEVASINGANFSSPELDQLLTDSADFFSFSEMSPLGANFVGVELVNVTYQPIDISFRLDYDGSFNLDEIRKSIQVSLSKYLDFRYFDPVQQRVEWDRLLQIIQNTPGVKYVPDQYFTPGADISIDTHKLPRIRGFLILDMDGNIIQNFAGTLNPLYYPNNPDFSYQQTVLNNI